MPIEAWIIAIVIAVVVGAAIVIRRRAALPPAAEHALPEAREREAPARDVDEGERAPMPDTVPKLPRAVPAPVVREGAAPLPVERPKQRGVTESDRHAAREQDRERIRKGLGKTRGGFVARLARVFRGKPKVGAELRDAIEEVLFTADIGASTAEALMKRVGDELDRREVSDPDAVWAVIEQAARELLNKPAPPTDFAPPIRPYVLLMIGVNGVGKTTTLGKLAAQHMAAGRKVLLVAGDTFRAGAVDQLDVWARRVGCAIHMGEEKADPSSVIYDGILRGRREGFDVVLCDTAGRLHTKKELMDELGKVRRAATKAIAFERPQAERDAIVGPHDTYLVLDATIGQNALAQAKLFKETTDFTGLVITKLDGTAKGGVVLGVCDELGVPIRYVGIGEGVDDLRPFEAEDFVAALFADRERAAADDEQVAERA